MIWGDIYIAGAAACLPARISVETAITNGWYDPAEARRTGWLSVAVAPQDQSAPDLAVAAADDVLRLSEVSAAEIGLVLHAVSLHSGIDGWNSTSYIQNELALGSDTLGVEVRAECDGMFAALEMASPYLRSHSDVPAALITASEVYPAPVVDRWRMNTGFVFADGGSALVVSRKTGVARLVAMATTSDASLQGLVRGDEPFGAFRHDARNPIDLDRRAAAFFRTMPRREMLQRHHRGIRAAVEQVLSESETTLAKVARVVLPFVGAADCRRDYLAPFHLDINRTTWELGRTVGHLGASDPVAALAELFASSELSPGDLTLIISEGAGFLWTAALIETV